MTMSTRNPQPIGVERFHKDKTKKTLLLCSVCKFGHMNIVKWLVTEMHVNLWHPNKHGETPLEIARQHGQLEVVKYLEYHDTNARNRSRLPHITERRKELELLRDELESRNIAITNGAGVVPGTPTLIIGSGLSL
jgi:ankyrin repeat protein